MPRKNEEVREQKEDDGSGPLKRGHDERSDRWTHGKPYYAFLSSFYSLCTDPAKWRGSRQPNNQTINHQRPGQRGRIERRADCWNPFTSPVNRRPADFDEQIH